jgi:Insertion element 4 transposase N-terminal
VAGQELTDLVSLGVLASRVPRDAVDDAVEATGKEARRRGGKLPPHVVVYLVMALALFAGEDYEEVTERLTGALRSWGSWDQRWEPPTKGAVTQARQRLGPEPLAELFAQVAEPVAGLDGEGAFLGPWRLMSVDGTELDVPDTAANREAFGAGANDGPFPKCGWSWSASAGRGAGAGRDGPVGLQGQRRAVVGHDALPAAGGGLAAARGPAVLRLGRLVRRRRFRR